MGPRTKREFWGLAKEEGTATPNKFTRFPD